MNTADWINRALVLLQAMLMAAAVFFGVNAGYRLLLGELAPCIISRAPESVAQKFAATGGRSFSEYAVISRRNLFATQEPSVRQRISSDIERLRQTRLKLKLRGTISGTEDTARAVIEDASGKGQFLVKVGDAIQDAVVVMILKGKIVLQVGGREELLEMDQWTSGLTPSPSSGSLPSAQIDDRQQVINVKRSQIDDAIKDINQLMKQVRIIPNFNQGKPDGLMISGIPQDSFFSQLGLRSGDILTGVDGKAIESVDDALKLYTGMKSGSRLKVQLKRGGREEVIDYAIE
ncbi:MAG: type II secretion system protein N [Desulfatirhabdiaceae bacterium]|nr:type II secretion system protein N [Desulfatirhabdiaceae bacterium]